MRALPFVLALLVAGPAGAQSPGLEPLYSPSTLASPSANDCSAIGDSLLRLRCFDEAAAKNRPVAASAPIIAEPPFTKYPAAIYRGRLGQPEFSGRDRNYASYRTRLREGARLGPNAAGNLTLVTIGCGAGCTTVYVIDAPTGTVSMFPLGGEDYSSLDLRHRADSRLVSALWIERGERCVGAELVWTGQSFTRSNPRDYGSADTCVEAWKARE